MIYPQRFQGKYRNIKDWVSFLLFSLYLLGSWIPYKREVGLSNQAIFIDLPQRRAYLFDLIIWPDELYYLTFILILAAFGLFIVTSLFGRVWCGYTCPHTNMIDLFLLVEKFFQGDRNARIKLDQTPMNRDKFIRKSLTHLVWLAMSFGFAFGWVGYFYEVRQLSHDLLHFSVTGNGLIWLIALTGTTYLFAGFMREKVCLHICPYGRFQSALFDQDTLLVTYQAWRGEPRGKKTGGDCIDCGLCVVACPMGIDIREGLQMACIGCGLCVDACNSVMNKIEKPEGLIDFTSEKSAKELEKNWPKKTKSSFILSPKLFIYSSAFLIALGSLVFALITKEPLLLEIDKEPNPSFTITPEGAIRNAYSLLVINKTGTALSNLCLELVGKPDAVMKIQGKQGSCFVLEAGQTLEARLLVTLSKDRGNLEQIKFKLGNLAEVKSVFQS